MKLKRLTADEIYDALPLVWDVFCRSEACSYPEEGKNAFYEAIHDEEYLRGLATGNEGSHIALFFVDGDYHRQGTGRKLFEECLKDSTTRRITVHSSEYAQEVYRKER